MRRIDVTALLLLAVLCADAIAQAPVVSDKVFRSAVHDITFRYPLAWIEKEPQLPTTAVLLYATDSSDATCNVNAAVLPELKGLSDVRLDALRKTNHLRPFFEETFQKTLSEVSILRYWRSHFGQKDAGAVEYEHTLRVGDTKIRVRAFMTATFANGRRYTLNCNAPLRKTEGAAQAFDFIRSTTLFIH